MAAIALPGVMWLLAVFPLMSQSQQKASAIVDCRNVLKTLRQTVLTYIRLLMQDQSGLGPHCLSLLSFVNNVINHNFEADQLRF